jgi:hypothetical protein
MDWIARDADVLERAFLVSNAPKFTNGSEHLLWGDEFAVVAVHDIKVISLQAIAAALDTLPYPLRRIVKDI